MAKEEFSLKPRLYDGILILDQAGKVLGQNRGLVHVLSEMPVENNAEEHAARVDLLLQSSQLREAITQANAQGESQTIEWTPDWWPDHTLAVSALREGDRLLVSVHDWTPIYKLGGMQQDFVANVSHELRTPLTAIRMAAESLQMGAMRDDRMRAKFLNNIQGEADRLTRLVNELLTVANLMGRPVLHISRFELQALADEVESTLSHHAKLANVNLVIKCPEEIPAIEADRDRLQQVLINLVDNAIKFTPASGAVTLDVSAMPDGTTVLCKVIDSGIGIPPIDLPRIFERFYRVDKARSRVTGGVGLGLSIVKDIIEAHHGKIEVTSEVNKGTTFNITLPVRQPQAEAAAV